LNYLYERDSNGNTPLLYATIHNKTEIALYFL
jgi:ankyrin repeat protein